MAEGIRIHHPTLSSCTLLIPHPGEERPGSQQNRLAKDYHIRLNSDGDCIVSETVWIRLKQARDWGLTPHEFIVLNAVPDPPAQGVGQGGAIEQPDRVYKQVQDAIHEIAPPGVQARAVRMNRG